MSVAYIENVLKKIIVIIKIIEICIFHFYTLIFYSFFMSLTLVQKQPT